MKRRASYKDVYRSTGYCRLLGGAGGPARAHHEARSANAATRAARMDSIIDRYLKPERSC